MNTSSRYQSEKQNWNVMKARLKYIFNEKRIIRPFNNERYYEDKIPFYPLEIVVRNNIYCWKEICVMQFMIMYEYPEKIWLCITFYLFVFSTRKFIGADTALKLLFVRQSLEVLFVKLWKRRGRWTALRDVWKR